MRLITLLALSAIAFQSPPCLADVLITDKEAALPAAPTLTMRGVTRGPGVKQINPNDVKSPFNLKVKFEPHGGAVIEPGSVKVTYLKSPAIDITDRVKPFISPDGIDMSKAEVPAGSHTLRVDVKDSDGRAGSATLTLTVK